MAVYNKSGQKLISYTYDAWGKQTVTNYTGSNSTFAIYNPFTYRGYYYDAETGFYYLNSRYYDPIVGRFINADGYVSTGQGIIGNNMYAYCGNNPVMNVDPSGYFWSEIAIWLRNTFGAGVTNTKTIWSDEKIILPNFLPITAATGTQINEVIKKRGDSSKPVSVYADKNINDPAFSSAGINININSFTLNLSVGLDNIGVYGAVTEGDVTNSLGLRLNLSKIQIGIENSTARNYDGKTKVGYTNISVSGWFVLLIYGYSVGHPVQSPVTVY